MTTLSTPTLTVSDASGTYNGAAFAATRDRGRHKPACRGQPGRRDPEPDLLLRHQRHGTRLERRSDDGRARTRCWPASPAAPTTPAARASTTFTISQGHAQRERDRRRRHGQRRSLRGQRHRGRSRQPVHAAASLEGVTPTLTYYSGTSASGTALTTAPSRPARTRCWPASPAAPTTPAPAQHDLHDQRRRDGPAVVGLRRLQRLGGAALNGEADGTGWNTSASAGTVGWSVQNGNTTISRLSGQCQRD